MVLDIRPIGDQVRTWRRRRRLSQLDLALEADISPRHLSFIETGRARPSRPVVERLARRLEVPPRAQNHLLIAAGFAPARPERNLDDPALAPARDAIDHVLKAFEPFPALAVDRHWDALAANEAASALMRDSAPKLLVPPVNVLRLSLHPDGLAPRIANLPEWRAHLLHRLGAQVEASGDEVLAELLRELRGYPSGEREAPPAYDGIAVPLTLETDAGRLSFLSTTTMFGTPIDITLAEIAIEAFLPADAETMAQLQGRWM